GYTLPRCARCVDYLRGKRRAGIQQCFELDRRVPIADRHTWVDRQADDLAQVILRCSADEPREIADSVAGPGAVHALSGRDLLQGRGGAEPVSEEHRVISIQVGLAAETVRSVVHDSP